MKVADLHGASRSWESEGAAATINAGNAIDAVKLLGGFATRRGRSASGARFWTEAPKVLAAREISRCVD
eukprot:9234827-Pyramimonas_sp.AAC.1